MGCGSSSEASSPGGYAGDDAEFTEEVNRKKQGGSNRKNEDEGNDMFEVEEAQGEQFMAVRPWIGQVTEPENHNEINKEKPDTTYALEYVYGYRSADSR